MGVSWVEMEHSVGPYQSPCLMLSKERIFALDILALMMAKLATL